MAGASIESLLVLGPIGCTLRERRRLMNDKITLTARSDAPYPLRFRLLGRRCWRRYRSRRSYIDIFRSGLRRENLLLTTWRRGRVDVDRFIEFVLDFTRRFFEFLDALAEAFGEFRQFFSAK